MLSSPSKYVQAVVIVERSVVMMSFLSSRLKMIGCDLGVSDSRVDVGVLFLC